MTAARRFGLRVPQDLSVIGVDDYLLSSVLGLTTVRQDVTAQGRRAAEVLLGALLEEEPMDDRTVFLPTELVVRESTAAPGG